MSPKPNLDQGGYGSFAGSAWSASQLRTSFDLIWLTPSPRGLAGRLWRSSPWLGWTVPKHELISMTGSCGIFSHTPSARAGTAATVTGDRKRNDDR
jgi:hypothetical protein